MVAQHCLAGEPLWAALDAGAPAPVQRIPQSALPAGQAFESFIAATGRCPTREGLHDFFNGLCWSLFPRTKAQLNRLQAEELARRGVQPTRGALRDTLTVFDENAAFLQAPDALWEALAHKDWSSAFGALRPLWQHSRLRIFGHALLEKLATPRKAHTAHLYRVGAHATLPELDAEVASRLAGGDAPHPTRVHLPVLGVPGWWTPNAAPDFYTDATVFRPPRRAPAQPRQYPERPWANGARAA